MTERVKSDGGSSAYYELPADAAEIMDLIEARNLPFWQANCLKAIWRIGQKDGVEEEYDLRKIIYFANRRLMQLGKEPSLRGQMSQIEVDFGDGVVDAINRRVDALVEEWLNKNAAFRMTGTEEYVLGGHRERFFEVNTYGGKENEQRLAFVENIKPSPQYQADANIAQGLPAMYGLMKDLD